jgi:predicted transcriptional regulator
MAGAARVHFHLPTELYNQWLQAAHRQGITPTRYLRQLLDIPLVTFINFPYINQEVAQQCSVRLSPEVNTRLIQQAEQWGVSRGSIIRNALAQSLYQVNTNHNPITGSSRQQWLDDLWNSGQLNTELDKLTVEIDKFNPVQQIILARCCIEAQQLDLAHLWLDAADRKLLGSTSKATNTFGQLTAARAHIARLQKRYHNAKQLLLQALAVGELTYQPRTAASLLNQLSTLAELEGNLSQAITFTYQGLEHLQITQNFSAYVKSYLRIAGLHASLGQMEETRRILTRILELQPQISKIGAYMQAFVPNRLSLIHARLQQYTSAKQHALIALNISNQFKFKLEASYAEENLYILHSVNQHSTKNPFQPTRFKSQLYALAFNNSHYKQRILNLQGTLAPSAHLRDIKQYLIAYLQLVQAPQHSTRVAAKQQLLRLGAEGSVAINQAAKYTLHSLAPAAIL